VTDVVGVPAIVGAAAAVVELEPLVVLAESD
jgi:hypothetical protein